MSDFINTIDALGDETVMDSIIQRTITEFKDDTLTEIGEHAFYECTALKKVDLPKVTTLNLEAFRGCTALISVDIPEAVTFNGFEGGYFRDCTSLLSADFPKATVTSRNMFFGCKSLVSVNFPEATACNLQSFYGCIALTDIDLPKVTTSQDGLFAECKSLKNVNLPLLTKGAQQMFFNCIALENITLPKLINIAGSHIYYSMFRNCGSLKMIDVPCVTTIETYGLCDCSGLTALLLRNTGAVCSLAATTGLNDTAVASGNLYIYVPSALIEDYKVATNWATYAGQFRALEDYTVDGTTTGELDETKI